MRSRVSVLAPVGLSLGLLSGIAGCEYDNASSLDRGRTSGDRTAAPADDTTQKHFSSGSHSPTGGAGQKGRPKD